MKPGDSWRIVYVAAFFALAIVGVAYGTYAYEKHQRIAKVVAVAKTFSPWEDVSNTVGTTSKNAISDAISEDLYAGYSTLAANQDTVSQQDLVQLVNEAVQKHVTDPAIVPNITLADLSVNATTSPAGYLATITYILAQSRAVKEYEPTVFTRVMNGSGDADKKTLAADAFLYQRIAAALLLTDVPPSLAPQHLETVKSIGALARAVANMAVWEDDAIQGLVAIDTFNKAEIYVGTSVSKLVADTEKLQQKKS